MKVDRDELLLYALGQLPPERAAAVEAALMADAALQGELRADQEALGLLLDDLDVQAAVVPEGAQERLLTRVRAEAAEPITLTQPVPETVNANPAKTAARPVWWWVFPLVAAVAFFLFTFRGPADPTQRYARMTGATTTTVMADGQALGSLVRLPDGKVFVHLSRAAQAGYTYQLWQIQAGQPVSLGVFGEAGLLTRPLEAGATLAVSVEPTGGSVSPTTKPLFAQRL